MSSWLGPGSPESLARQWRPVADLRSRWSVRDPVHLCSAPAASRCTAWIATHLRWRTPSDSFAALPSLRDAASVAGWKKSVWFQPFLAASRRFRWHRFICGTAIPRLPARVAVVGIRGLSSFDSNFAAERLAYHASKLDRGSKYIAYEIELSTEEGTVPGTLQYGNRDDRDAHFREELRDALKPIAAKANAILLPGILGLKSGQMEIEWLENQLGCLVCEMATLPPSIPGMRLFNRLEARLRKAGVEVFTGFPIQQIEIENGHFKGVLLEAPARPLHLSSETLILATGPFSGRLLGDLRLALTVTCAPWIQPGRSSRTIFMLPERFCITARRTAATPWRFSPATPAGCSRQE